MEEVVENLKACLLSSRGGIRENRIEQDYFDVVGERLPYKKLEFRSLVEFLNSVPGIKRFFNGSEYIIQALPTDKTSHLANLVRGQKPAKKPKRMVSYNRSVTSPYDSNKNFQNPTRPKNKTTTTLFSTKTPQQTNRSLQSNQNFQKGNINNRLFATDQSRVPSSQYVQKIPSPENELEALAADLKLAVPVYNTLSQKGIIYAQVKVGNEKYSSYPKGAKISREAQLYAAEKALEELKQKHRSVMLPVTREEELMKEQMLRILDSHPSGVFSSQFTRYYQEEFKQSLPEDWMRIVNESPKISVETGVNDTRILTRYIPLQTKALESPEFLEWPDDPYVIVHVSEVLSTTEVWGVIIDDEYSEKLEDIMRKMITFYETNLTSTKARVIVPGLCFSIRLEDKWFRVKCEEYDPKTEKAQIFFIDNGKTNTCHAKLLHRLDKQFNFLPAQAVKLSLYDLEEFSDYKNAQTVVKDFLLEKDLCIQIQSSDSEDGCKSVIFYDTQDTDLVNLNNIMTIEIIKSCITEPQLKPERRITDVYVTHISQSGEVYVRLSNDHMEYLKIKINVLVEEKLEQNLSQFTVGSVDLMQLYLVKSHEDGQWYRAGIFNVNRRTNEVDVFFLDFGNTMTVKINELIDLQSVSTILAIFPAQAIKLQLHNISPSSFNQEKVTRLKEIVPVNQYVLVRVVQRPFNGSIPIVEMYKRKQPSNEIVSINNTLIFDSELAVNLNNNDEIKNQKERLTKQLKRN